MLKKTIKHKDIDGREVETDAYFNMTKAECIELNIRTDIDLIARSRNNNETMDAFARIMRMSYGIRTPDGQFLKIRPEGGSYFDQFATTEAYSELFMELFGNEGKASDFIKGILPAGVIELGEGQQASQSDIPEHLRNHPKMQGRRAAAEPERREAPKTFEGVREASRQMEDRFEDYKENVASQVIARTPEFETEQELAEFEAWKASRGAAQTPPDRVSPPEDTQAAPTVREDLV